MNVMIVGVLFSLFLLSATPSFAESFLDVYAGPSFTDDAAVTIKSRVAANSKNVTFEKDLSYGVRGGHWFTRVPWLGVAGDLSAMHAKGASARFDFMPFTPMALFRLPLLTDEETPQGWLQPYIGIGPSVALYTYASADNGPPTGSISNWGINGGFQVPAGVAVQLSKHFALFGEYRYAYYRVNVLQNGEATVFNTIVGNSDTVARKVNASLSLHNALFGISFRF